MSKKYWTDVVVKREDGQTETTKIYVVKPSNAVEREANQYRAKTWQECIKAGVMTHQEVVKVLEERKVWDEEKSQKEENLKKKLADLQKKLYVGNGDTKRMKLSAGKQIAIDMRIARNELRDLLAVKISMEENTAEALSNNARFDYIVASCTFDENDQPVYKNIDDYNSRSSDETAFAAASKLGEVVFGLDGKFEQNLPENQWLKKFNFVDDELSLIDKDKHLVTVDGKRIDSDGYYLNADNKRVDKDGNLLTEDGGYELQVEYEDDTDETTTTEKPTDS